MAAREYLTTGEVARYCAISLSLVQILCNRGVLKCWRIAGRGGRRKVKGRHRRIDVQSVRNFMAANDMPIPSELQIEAS